MHLPDVCPWCVWRFGAEVELIKIGEDPASARLLGVDRVVYFQCPRCLAEFAHVFKVAGAEE